MTRARPQAYKGSEKWLQIAVNDCQQSLYCPIASKLAVRLSWIEWLSPLREDGFTEYSDRRFIERLDVVLENRPLNTFWPRRGPEWDALGRTDNGHLLLVEAKSHVAEMQGPGSSAKSKKSIDRIVESFRETQHYIGADDSVNWLTSSYYQYANRLAHLFLLRELNGLPAYLVMLYFLNDTEQGGPPEVAEWGDAIVREEKALGISHPHPLSDFIIDAFVDVRELEAIQ